MPTSTEQMLIKLKTDKKNEEEVVNHELAPSEDSTPVAKPENKKDLKNLLENCLTPTKSPKLTPHS